MIIMDFEYIKYSRTITPDFVKDRFPGFYSDECYFILADYFNSKCVDVLKRKIREDDSEVEDSECSKEIKLEDNVTHSEQFSNECECSSEQSGQVQRSDLSTEFRLCEFDQSPSGQSSTDISEQVLHDTTESA